MRVRVLMLGATALVASLSSQASAQVSGSTLERSPPGVAAAPSGSEEEDEGAASADAVEQVVVTARRRVERLQDIPVAGTAISGQLIEDQGGFSSMRQIFDNAPGVNYFDTGTTINSEPTIRGQGGGRGNASNSAESAVGLFRDGVFVPGGTIGGKSYTRMDTFDLERSEILRGPQGALYGRNSVGGAINVITAKPGFTFGGKARASLSTNERMESEFIVNLPLVADTLALRVGLDASRQREGFYYNPSRVEFSDRERYAGARVALRYSKGPLDATLSADHFSLLTPGVLAVLSIPGAVDDPFIMEHNSRDNFNQHGTTVTLQASYDLGFATLTSVTGYRQRDTTLYTDDDGSVPARCPAIVAFTRRPCNPNAFGRRPDETERFYTSNHLTGSFWNNSDWLVGVEYTQVESQFRVESRGIPAPRDVRGSSDFRSAAVFGSVDLNVAPRLDVSLEGRYTRDDKQYQTANFALNPTTLAVTAITRPVNAQSDPDNFSYAAAATFRLTPDWMVYGRVGTGYRAGSFNADPGTPETDPRPITIPYDDETTTSYEAGSKIALGRWANAALTAFKSRTENLVVADTNGVPIAPIVFLRNGGTGEVWGVELEGTVRGRAPVIGGRVRFSFGISHSDGEIVEGPDAGKKINRIPDLSYNTNLNYRRPLGGPYTFFANVNTKTEEGGFFDIQNVFELQSFTRADGRLGLEVNDTRFTLFSRNLTDELYKVFQTAAAYRLNQPRVVGVEISRKW